MIVVSGADLVGKTTFCQKLVERLQDDTFCMPHMLHHLSRIPKWFDAYHDYIDRMCVTSIWDRFHLDELAYRFCDDRSTQMTPLKWDLVQAEFKRRCGFQVVIYASAQHIEERFRARGDSMYNLEHILKVNDTFMGMVSKGTIIVRDQPYIVNVDMLGKVTEGDLIERVARAYRARLKEFRELTQGTSV